VGRDGGISLLISDRLAVSLAVALTMTFWLRSLFSVAVGQACVLLFWWLINERRLCSVTCRSRRNWIRVFGVVAWSMAGYAFALWSTSTTGWQMGCACFSWEM
jgi:hypothetical protein